MTMTIHNRLYDLFLIRLCQDQYILFSDASGTDINHLDWYLISAADAMDSFNSWSPHADSRRRQWHSPPVLLPGKSHGRRSHIGYSPWGRKELDMTERLHFHFSLSCFGEGNGNPLQCSCLENPGTVEPGGLPSMESHRVGHDWSDLAAAAACWQCFTSSMSRVYFLFQELGHLLLGTSFLLWHCRDFLASRYTHLKMGIKSLRVIPQPTGDWSQPVIRCNEKTLISELLPGYFTA